MDSKPQEMDFEDVLKQFEKTFSKCERGRTYYKPDSSRKGPHQKPAELPTNKTPHLEPNFQELCEEIIHHIHLSRQTMSGSRAKISNPMSAGVSKEVLRAEIRTTLSELRSFQGTSSENLDDIPSSQRAIIVSLKRRLRESKETLAKEQKKNKQLELSNKRLQGVVGSHQTTIANYEESEKFLEKEIDELRNKNALITKDKAEFQKSKQRSERLVGDLRSQLVVVQHEIESTRMENDQLTVRIQELEKRNKAAKKNEAAITVRIQELKEIQDEMLAHMASAHNGADMPGVQKALATLSERRSRLVGRIATLLTKKNQANSRSPMSQNGTEEDSRNATNMSSPVSVADHSHTEPDSRTDPNGAPTLGATRSPSTFEDGGKRPFLSIFKTNNDLTRTFTNRASRKTALATFEKTRIAVEKDTVALKEVITVKDSELERLEEELDNAKERANSLEKQLQRERHARKQENRNMRVPAVEKAKMEMSFASNSRRINQTLFDWQSSPKSGSSAELTENSAQIDAEIQISRTAVEGNSSDSKDDLFPSESSTSASMSNSLSQ